MKLTFTQKKHGFTLVELLVVIAIMASLAAISTPIIVRQIKQARVAQATNNSQDIAIGLYNYHFQYKKFPVYNAGYGSSNEYFRLLFSTGTIRDEKPFFLKTDIPNASQTPPDEDINGANALSAGENLWSYFVNTTQATDLTIADNYSPVAGVPFTTGGSIPQMRADYNSFGGKAIILRVDKSSTVYFVDTTGALTEPDIDFGDQASDYNVILPLFETL